MEDFCQRAGLKEFNYLNLKKRERERKRKQKQKQHWYPNKLNITQKITIHEITV